jgi:hypothetical protein
MAATGNSDIAGLLQRVMALTLLTWVALTAIHAGRLSLAARQVSVREQRDEPDRAETRPVSAPN